MWIALRIGCCSKFENSGSAYKSASSKSSKVSTVSTVVEVAVMTKGNCIKIQKWSLSHKDLQLLKYEWILIILIYKLTKVQPLKRIITCKKLKVASLYQR